MWWAPVTDANGNDFEALTRSPYSNVVGSEIDAWVFFDKESGFDEPVGEIVFKPGLKRLGEPNLGKYGA